MTTHQLRHLLLLSAVLCLSTTTSWGGEGYWRDLPPEQRRELRQQMREHWAREHAAEQPVAADAVRSRPRWHDLPREERRRLREEMRAQHGDGRRNRPALAADGEKPPAGAAGE